VPAERELRLDLEKLVNRGFLQFIPHEGWLSTAEQFRESDRISDYCSLCPFNPKTVCPVTSLYWAFLARHEGVLQTNPRLSMPMASLRKRDKAQRHKDQGIFRALRETLGKGEAITPQSR
jgi:deoxyribodipyrimidine photolyase-like uncharacterized protein